VHESCDVLVVGGGINGAGVARDAAGRGLRTVLCEQHDLASHTSSASTKLVHGGLRYLEYYDFGLVRKSLLEREVVLASAPHLSWPLRFVLPHDSHLRPAWMIRAGLFLYDHLATRRTLPASRKIDLRKHPAGRSLNPRYRTAFEYSDGWVDDARLVVANAVDAFERGAEVLTRTACVRLQRDSMEWIATLRTADGRERTLRTRIVVNAAGPWVAEFLDHCTPTPARHHPRMIRGSHIVVRKLFDHDFAYIFQAPDGRIVFALPYEGGFTLIGTTDSEYTGNLAHPAITAAEQAYLLDMANRYFQRDLGVSDVVWTFAGLRPLLAASMDEPKSVTRDYVIDFDRSGPPLLSMYGGKLTTYRRLAEQVVDCSLRSGHTRVRGPGQFRCRAAPVATSQGSGAGTDRHGWLHPTIAPLRPCVRHAHRPAARRMLAGHGSRRGSAARSVRARDSLSAHGGIRPHRAGHPLSPQQARRAPGRGQRENPGRVACAALTPASVRVTGDGFRRR
jgi:glycerol-3-phosphate dehydrogenase